MLRQGVSLPSIGAVLRHASVETTAHYAKVDIALLQQVARPWPEVTYADARCGHVSRCPSCGRLCPDPIEGYLRQFARFAGGRGETHVVTSTAIAWATLARRKPNGIIGCRR